MLRGRRLANASDIGRFTSSLCEALQASLALYPRYAAALEELGKLHMDQGLYESLGFQCDAVLRLVGVDPRSFTAAVPPKLSQGV